MGHAEDDSGGEHAEDRPLAAPATCDRARAPAWARGSLCARHRPTAVLLGAALAACASMVAVCALVLDARSEGRVERLRRATCQSLMLLAAAPARAPARGGAGAYSDCKHVFIDGGSNIGDNIDTFAGVSGMGEVAKARNTYLEAIGAGVSEVCAFGFEGNRKFDQGLKDKEERYAGTFKHIRLYTRTVLADEAKRMFLAIDNTSDVASSILKSGGEQQAVDAIDLADFISQFELRSLFVKLDVEGAEYGIMKKLVREGLLCQPGVHTVLAIEFHQWLSPSPSIYPKYHEPGYLNLLRCCGVAVYQFHR